MRISLIAAMSQNRVIGIDGSLPWHLPADLQHFKKLTLGKSIVMGRKTYESIAKPLPGRQNLILSKDANYTVPGCIVLNSVEDVESYCKQTQQEELCVIGGAQIYSLFLAKAQYIYMTKVMVTITGDTYFPLLDTEEWSVVEEETHLVDEKNIYPYCFMQLERCTLKTV